MTDQLKVALKAMNNRPVAYNPAYAVLTGSVTGGILLSQLVYWAAAMDWAEFYKTNSELTKETGLTIEELRSAKKKIINYVEITKKGAPCKTWYKLDIDRILANLSSCGKSPQPVAGNPRNQLREIPATIYTEITTENTTDIISGPAGEPQPGAATEPEDTTGQQVNRMIGLFSKVNPTGHKTFYRIKKQREAIKNLLATIGEEELSKRILQLEEHNRTPRAWIMTTPAQLEAGLSNMIAFWEQKDTAKASPTGQQRGVLRDGSEVIKINGEWRDALNPFGVTLSTAYYPEIAKGEVISKRDWDAGKRYT